MSYVFRPLVSLALLAVGCSPSTVASEHATVEPVPRADPPGHRRVALLGGHTTLVVPASAGEVEDAHVAGAVVESRLPLEPPSGDGLFAYPRFHLTTTELHARTSGDVLVDARHVFRDDWELDPEPHPSGRIAWVLGERVEWNGEVPFAVLGALVVHDDGTLQRMMFRVAADVPPSDRAGYAQRARAIVESLRAGERVSLAGGTHRVGELELRAPDGFRFTCEEAPDAITFCGLRHVGAIDEPQLGMVSLRLVPARQIELPPPSGAERMEAPLLGRTAAWYASRGEGLILRTSAPISDRRLEITIYAPDEDALRALRRIVETLRPHDGGA